MSNKRKWKLPHSQAERRSRTSEHQFSVASSADANPPRVTSGSPNDISNLSVINSLAPTTLQNSQLQIPAINSSEPPGGVERSAKKTKWPGLQSLKYALQETTSAFEPLKSAISRLAWCFENETGAREGYEAIKVLLDGLLQDLSAHLGDTTPPSMTRVINTLSRDIKVEAELIKENQEKKRKHHFKEAEKDENEVMDCYRRIQTLVERLKMNANLSVWKTVDEQALVRCAQRMTE
ncbi:hypothetical protein FRC12_011051 [Ceratobasidium sp. 428]|nr:hypothetical protein FRC12_011051 [Ceratobasidium sp. 428]